MSRTSDSRDAEELTRLTESLGSQGGEMEKKQGRTSLGPTAKAMHRSGYLIRTTQLEVTPYRPRPPSPSPGQKFWERACDWPSHDPVHTPVNNMDGETKDSAMGRGEVVSTDHQDPHDGESPRIQEGG